MFLDKSILQIISILSDYIRTIRDPEKPSTLEDLNVIYEDGIFVKKSTADNVHIVRIEFNPTVPHCSLATLIGLCIRIKIERSINHKLKLDIYIKKGAHTTEDESEFWQSLFFTPYYEVILILSYFDLNLK